MSINQNSSTVVHFIADGVVKEFNFPFRIFAKEDIDVYVNEVLINQGYDVETEDEVGGKVIFTQAPSLDSKITIIRNLEIKRTSDFQEGGAFRAKVINHELDYQVASIQQLDEKIERAMIYPPYGQEKPNLVLPLPSSGKALVWNQEANGLENSTININDTISIIEDYANQAKESATEAKNQKNKSEDFANQAQETAKELNIFSTESIENINRKLEEAISQANRAAEEANKASQYAESASFGNIGDIKYTSRTDVPNGGAWCDGAEYTKEAFPDIYQMLVDGKLQSTSVTDFNSKVSASGSCGFFGLDISSERFKVPLLKDVYIKAGQTLVAFGEESLPNITGKFNGGLATYTPSGAFVKDGTWGDRFGSYDSNACNVFDFKASRSSSTYKDGAKVNPDHVIYRAYVVLYSSVTEASEAQAQEFTTALGSKANVDLSNVTNNIDYVVEQGTSGTTWYRKYKSGWLEQGGNQPEISSDNNSVTFMKPFANEEYSLVAIGKNIGKVGSQDVTTRQIFLQSTTRFNLYEPNNRYKAYSWYACGQGA